MWDTPQWESTQDLLPQSEIVLNKRHTNPPEILAAQVETALGIA